jgi:group I intron endonuclease
MTGIYAIINTINGKRYVGQSVNIHKRMQDHFRQLGRGKHICKYFQYAFNKAGADVFGFAVLEECGKEALTEREQFWMDYYRDRGLYNSVPAAGSNLGMRHTAEAKEKMAVARRGKHLTAEAREKIAAALTGQKRTAEARANMTEAQVKRKVRLGSKQSEETRKKISASLKGRVMTDEHKAKIAAKSRARVITPETRAKMSLVHRGAIVPEGVVAKRRETIECLLTQGALRRREDGRLEHCHL